MSLDWKLETLRRERSERYQKLSAAERPRVVPCADCGRPPYTEQICPETGLFHDRDRHKIIGGAIVQSNIVRSSELMDAIDLSRVRWSESRTRLVRGDASSLNLFQGFVRHMDWSLQRYGILYGKYDEDSRTIEVHAIYEPEQCGDAITFSYTADARIHRVDEIAKLLKLRRVGAICTHPPRNPEDIVLNSREMLLCAREQSRFGDECVLLTVGPNVETGRVECQAWQASPQAVHFYRLGVLQETNPADPEEAKFVQSTIALEVAQQDTDGKGHPRFVTKEPSHRIDTRWFTSYVAVQQFESPVVRNLFVRISRPGMEPPTMWNLRNYMEDPKRRASSFVDKISDFHVLIYLSEGALTVEELTPAINGIVNKSLSAERTRYYETFLRPFMLD